MPTFKRKVHNFAKTSLYSIFNIGQRMGMDILPRHFYSSIPDMRQLKQSAHWRMPMSMAGVAGADIESQLAFVSSCCKTEEIERLKKFDVHSYAAGENGEMGFGPAEAEFLYCFICAKRPGRVVQVGAGVSTAVILRAADDCGFKIELTCVDPFPGEYLRRLDREGKIKLIAKPAQEVDFFHDVVLGDNDMLFIDSTHTVKVGSEVNKIILEVLPRLPKNVYVHFHDIYFPYDYNRLLLSDPFFPSESTLLQAFLANNSKYVIRVAMSMLHYAKSGELKKYLPNYRPAANDDGLAVPGDTGHFPASIYLQTVE